jgi:hypothetical protein
MLCSLKKSNNRVIPNLPAEGGQERDLTMRMNLLGRKTGSGGDVWCAGSPTGCIASA